MSQAFTIRRGETADAQAISALYDYYVANTPITFDIEPKSRKVREDWLNQFSDQGRYQLFIAEWDGVLAGYSCSMQFRIKAAYDTSVETSVYVAHGYHGKGVGRALYSQLFDVLKSQEVHRAYAGITEPNPGSVALHEAFGFKNVGTFHEVGLKFEKYWDVAWFERAFD